jgi:hypothetical protein
MHGRMFGLFLILLFLGVVIRASGPFPAEDYPVDRAQTKIKVDGLLDEEAWQGAVKVELGYEWLPGDNVPAPVKTECLLTFSQSKLYVAFRCFDPEPGKIRAHLMDRDSFYIFKRDDYVGVMIDTFNDERRAFQFRVNPLGVQVDASFSELEGEEDFSWDAIWNSAAKVTDFGYTVEMAIPFSQLRFSRSPGPQTWGFSLERSYPRTVRRWLGSHMRSRSISCILCQANKMTGFAGVSPGKSLEFDPTLTIYRTDQREDFPEGEMDNGSIELEPGISARWGITPNIMLNATVNPDFSQVEADVAQLEVNQRFALYYPEKRPFFLEGADFFQTLLPVVFTRTVFDPYWGVKLSGKQGKNAFGLFSARDRFNNLVFPANQFSQSASLTGDVFSGVFRYRRDIGKGSTLGLLYTGRGGDEYYNHVAGLDGFLRLSRTKSITFQALRSWTDYPTEVADQWGQRGDAFADNAFSVKFRHFSRNFNLGLEYEDLGAAFRADYGFVPRVDLRRLGGYLEPVLWGKKGGWFERLSFLFWGEKKTDQHNNLTDQDINIGMRYAGPLQIDWNVLMYIQKELYNGVVYDKTGFSTMLEITPRKGLVVRCFTAVGDYVDYTNSRLGDDLLVRLSLDFNPGKHLNLGFSHTLDRLSLEGEKIYAAHLFQSRLIYNFNVRTFIRAMVQYTHIDRNVDLYLFPIDPESRKLFTQFLFSYKINPQTVLFIGYSDNHFGMRGIDLTRNDRTFFLKLGYALAL